MAQTGFTPIQLYYSSTSTNAPSAGNLASGELAINITDGKLFYKDNANAVQVIGWKTTPTSAGGTGLTSYTAGDTLYYASGTSLTKLAIGTAYQALQVNAGATAPSWQPSATSVLTTQGDLLYASGANTLARLAKDANATRYLSNTGTSNNPAWAQINLSNGVTGTLPTTNGGTGITSFTSGGVVYASSTSALTTGSALSFDGTVLSVPGGVKPYSLVGSAVANNINWDGAQFYPSIDGTILLGYPSFRWNTVYASVGTINTSDANQKQDIAELNDAEKRVAVRVKSLIKKYRFKDAYAKKGDQARIHIGAIAQEVQQAFELEGLDAARYGIFCSDTWYEVDGKPSKDLINNPYTEKTEGAVKVTQLGLRYGELLSFVIAAM